MEFQKMDFATTVLCPLKEKDESMKHSGSPVTCFAFKVSNRNKENGIYTHRESCSLFFIYIWYSLFCVFRISSFFFEKLSNGNNNRRPDFIVKKVSLFFFWNHKSEGIETRIYRGLHHTQCSVNKKPMSCSKSWTRGVTSLF